MTIAIKPVRHEKGDTNRYCGPSAISAITGITTGAAARLIRDTGGRSSIRGSTSREVLSSLRRCGVQNACITLDPTKSQTLAAWIRTSKDKRGTDPVLVVAGNHWQIVQGRRYVCGLTGEIVSIKHEKVRRRSRVTEAYRLTGKVAVPAQYTAKPKAAVSPDRAKFLALCKKHGLTYKTTGVPSPDSDIRVSGLPAFPDGWGAFHYDWCETRDRVEFALRFDEKGLDPHGCHFSSYWRFEEQDDGSWWQQGD